MCLLTTLLPNVFAVFQAAETVQGQSQVWGVIVDPVGDVSIKDDISPYMDIVRVSFSYGQGKLAIDFEIGREFPNWMMVGYYILFDTDQNTSTGCPGYREMDSSIGADYFIAFDPILVPGAGLCSSYRPWVGIKELQCVVNGSVATIYLTLPDIGLSGDLVQFDVVARTYHELPRKLYWDRAPDEGIFTLTMARATVDIYPSTLNLGVESRWVAACIGFAKGFDVHDIDVSSILLNGTIPVAPSAPVTIADYDNDGIAELIVSFNGTEIADFIFSKGITTGNVTLNMDGCLVSGMPFESNFVIRVRMPGDVNIDGIIDMADVSMATDTFLTWPGHPLWDPDADLNADGSMDMMDIAIILENFGRTYF